MARIMQAADEDAVVEFWASKAVRVFDDMKAPVNRTLRKDRLTKDGRAFWVVTGDRAITGVCQMYFTADNVVMIPYLAFDPDGGFSDAQVQTLIDEVTEASLAMIPDGWSWEVSRVPKDAVHARRWCDRNYPRHKDNELGERTYSGSVAEVVNHMRNTRSR